MLLRIFLPFILLFSLQASGQRYIPGDNGSKVHFVIKNFGIKTGGDLSKIKGEIIFFTTDLSACRFNVTIDPSTIDTDNGSRDNHLKGSEYFDVEKFPDITITSTKIDKTNKTEAGYYYFTGTLSMHGITKEIAFPFKAEKTNDSYLFTGEFEIDRLVYGIGDKSAVLSNTVNVSLSVLAKKG